MGLRAMTTIEALRGPKLFGMALFDLAGTVVISKVIGTALGTSFIHTFLVIMLIAILVHYLLGVHTQLNFYLHLNNRVR